KISLRKWFIAIWLVTNHKIGLSSYQLANDIEVTQKTAWYMLHKIRHAMRLANENILEEAVEIDETVVGGKNGNRHKDKKVPHSQGRSHKDKFPVVGMIQRENLMNARATPDTKSDTLSAFIKEYIHPDAIIYTDEYNAYDQIGFSYTRFYVDHSKKLYSYDHITTNRIEGTWTHFKRMVKGTYRTLLKKYLQKYVDEFVYRYNLRDISNSDRFNCFLCCADTRYTYKQIKESVCLK
ncbi:IS1595 family transposase, partial [Bacteroides fragilis]|nr:IS1595 family transposase [Bacteroides fragilis]MCE8767535.1 IS1595 family transposase [Bacteroides fragilis]